MTPAIGEVVFGETTFGATFECTQDTVKTMASYHPVPTAHEVSPEADHDDDYSDSATLLGPGGPKLPVPWMTLARPWAHPALLVGSHIFVLVLGGVLGSLLIMNANPSNTFATCGDVVSRGCWCF